MPDKAASAQQHSVITNLLVNIIIPTLILTKLSSPEYLGPRYSIVIALAFPLAFGLVDFYRSRKTNFFSVLGIVSILLTGGISLLELDPKYIAIKEASIPALIGIATLLSLRTPWPLIKTFIFNDSVIDTTKVQSALEQHQQQTAFEKALKNATYMVAASFALSSFLNYALAKYLLTSPPGTPEYSAQLGKMTGLSFPVIALPCTLVMLLSVYYLVSRIKALTELSLEEIFRLN